MFESDYLLTCRLCRKSACSFIDIYNPKGTQGLIVWKVIKDLIQLDVCKDDSLPSTICEECMDKLVEFRMFKAMCINSRIEFLKESVNLGLVEAENEAYQKQAAQRCTMVACVSVEAIPGVRDPLQDAVIQNQCYSSEAENDVRGSRVVIQSSVFHGSGTNRGSLEARECSGNLVGMSRHSLESAQHVNRAEMTLAVPMRPLVQNANVPQESVYIDCQSDPQEAEGVPRQYMQPRLDEGIGSLKACDAPNCRKVFSSYKALVIHKRAKHSGVESKSSVAEGDLPLGHGVENSQERGVVAQHQDLHDQGQGLRIEEFFCGQPSCKMKFPSLSSLLNHQLTHSPGKNGDKPRPPSERSVNASESDDEVTLVEVDPENSGSVSSDDCYQDEIEIGGSREVPCSPHKGEASTGRGAKKGRSGSTSENSPEGSIPGEPEFLCHWLGCGKAFLSFDQLLLHKKRKHPVDRGALKHDTPAKKTKLTGLERELLNLETDMSDCGSSRKQHSLEKTDKVSGRSHSKSSNEAAKAKEKPVPCAEESLGGEKTYLCAWPSCHLVFNSCKELHSHQSQYQHGRRKIKSPPVNAGESSEASDGNRNASQVKHKDLESCSSRNGALSKNVRIKVEAMTDTDVQPVDRNGRHVGQSVDGSGLDFENFDCEYPGCPKSYATFKSLYTHYQSVHRQGKKSKRPKSNVRSERK